MENNTGRSGGGLPPRPNKEAQAPQPPSRNSKELEELIEPDGRNIKDYDMGKFVGDEESVASLMPENPNDLFGAFMGTFHICCTWVHPPHPTCPLSIS